MAKHGSKDSKSRRISKLHDRFKSYDNLTMFFVYDYLGLFTIWNQSTVDNGGVRRGRFMAVGVIDRWKVTCDTRHVKYNM